MRNILTALLLLLPLCAHAAEMKAVPKAQVDLLEHTKYIDFHPSIDAYEVDVWMYRAPYVDECLSAEKDGYLRENCKPQALYIVVSDRDEYGSQFGFRTPLGHDWAIKDIEETK